MNINDPVIPTRSGRIVDPLNLKVEDIDIDDIAHSLSLLCRFNGHTTSLYSVADHSIRVAQELRVGGAPRKIVLWGLLHDASEAYLGDMARPLKRTPEMQFYRDAEERAMRVIAERYDLGWPMPNVVKEVDQMMCVTEWRDLIANKRTNKNRLKKFPIQLIEGIEPFKGKIKPQSQWNAYLGFLAGFEALTPDGVK